MSSQSFSLPFFKTACNPDVPAVKYKLVVSDFTWFIPNRTLSEANRHKHQVDNSGGLSVA